MKQAIGIPNHFLYSYEEQYMPSLIYSDKVKARDFHSTRHLIDDLYDINDGREFGRSIYVTYPKELQVKVVFEFGYNHNGRNLLYISHLTRDFFSF